MTDIIVDGTVRADWVPTIADPKAPKLTELSGTGVLALTPRLTRAGLNGFGTPETADVPADDLSKMTEPNEAGTYTLASPTLQLRKMKLDEEDTVYDGLTYRTRGYIVVRRWVPWATAYATGDIVDVIPAMCGMRRNLDAAQNEKAKYEVPIKVWDDPQFGVLVVAGA